MNHLKRLLLLGAVAGAAMLIPVAGASAHYGRGAYRQIELSANLSGSKGGGAWLWIELNEDGEGNYSGADCGRGAAGASSDKGVVEWKEVENEAGQTELIITGAKLNGFGGFPTTITVPAAIGHYTGTLGSFLTLPLPPFVTEEGNSQVQVAP